MNGYDKDFVINLNRVFSISARNLPKMDLVVNGGFQNPYFVNHAGNASGTRTIIKFTEANSNVCQIISKNFSKDVVIQGSFSTRPGRSGASLGPSGLHVRAFLDVPMSTWIRNTEARDTFDIELPNGDTASTKFNAGNSHYNVNADSGNLIVKFDNQFPIGFNSYIYLIDAQNRVIDSLHQDRNGLAVSAGKVGVNDRVAPEDRGIGSFTVPLNTTLATHINRTKRAICVVRGQTYNSTTPNTYVRFYADYTLKVRIIGDLNVTQTLTGK
jgi:hypothetical protein